MTAAVLSPAERAWLAGGFNSVRADGRAPSDVRPVAAAAGVLPAAAGSAEVRLGGTHVVVGVKLELQPPHPATPSLGAVHVDVDVSPVAGPDDRGGRPRDDDAAELAASLAAALASGGGLDLASLCVAPGVAVWHVYVDALLLGVDGGAPTALALAAAAALADARVPRVTVQPGEGGAPPEVEVDDDLGNATPLDTAGVPVVVAVAAADAAGGGGVVADPDAAEEAAAAAVARVAVAADGSVRGVALTKGGVTQGALGAMVALARSVAPRLRAETLRAAAEAAAAAAR